MKYAKSYIDKYFYDIKEYQSKVELLISHMGNLINAQVLIKSGLLS